MKDTKDVVIYPKDIQRIIRKKDKSARLLHEKIKKAFNKPKNGLITVGEFCAYTGMDKEIVNSFIF